jgi:hypothetical protein
MLVIEPRRFSGIRKHRRKISSGIAQRSAVFAAAPVCPVSLKGSRAVIMEIGSKVFVKTTQNTGTRGVSAARTFGIDRVVRLLGLLVMQSIFALNAPKRVEHALRASIDLVSQMKRENRALIGREATVP